MSDEKQNSTGSWTSVQVYVMALICLIVGVAVGYLFRRVTPAAAANPATATTVQAPSMPSGTEMGGNGQNASVTTDQLKRMADKKAAPLMEELKKNPNDSEALTKAANIYFATRQFEKAVQYFEKAAQLKPSPDALTKLSNAYYYSGASDKAFATLNDALKLDPTYANALFNLGMLKWQVQSDPKGAIECWRKLLKTNPNHPNRAQVEEMIARAKQHQERPDGAPGVKPAKM